MNLLIQGIEKGEVIKTDLTRKLTIDGITDIYPVYKVRLNNLYFNDQNDRIATWISQYKADNNIEQLDMTDIEKYNEIIHKFINDSNPEAIKSTQSNISIIGQREAGVILTDGRIIDGNRRVTCLRNLSKDKPIFNYFETVILEKSLEHNAKQIKLLELMIQHGEEGKVDYNPIDRLVGIYNDLIKNKLLTVEEYAITNTTPNEIRKQMELAQLMVDFLKFINASEQFHIARDLDLNGPLVELQGILKKIKNEDDKEDIKSAVFTNLLVQPDADMTRFIRKIKNVAQSKYLKDYIEEQLTIAEDVLDKLPTEGKMTKKIINDVFKNDDELKRKLDNSLTLADGKAKSEQNINMPLDIMEKVATLLETIDTNIFRKLKDERITNLRNQIDKVEEILGEIREATDVH